MAQLVDTYGRVHRDLRLSVTDRCNFRCTYCMPAEGLDWVPREEVLTFEEIERVTRVCVERFGVEQVRLTGGEPTVRAHLPTLVAMLARLGVDVAMTTNGTTLRSLARPLRQAGLRRINISCDSLRRDRFLALTRRDELARVLDGIDAALEAGFDPVKVNVVAMRGVNDDEVLDFAAWGRERGVVVRFIEFMPLDADHDWSKGSVVSYDEIVDRLSSVYALEPLTQGSDPAQSFRYADGGGEVGVIASVTRSFCASCDRLRLTAEGKLRNCLFALDETDLRPLLRGGGSDDDLAAALEASVAAKWAGHGIGTVSFVQPPRSMSQIGG